MNRYFRIQPAGLGLDHRSETSAFVTETVVDADSCEREVETLRSALADGLHVFATAEELLSTDVPAQSYGDEVVVLEAERHWANGDVEGVCVDGSKARVVARIPLEKFRAGDWA